MVAVDAVGVPNFVVVAVVANLAEAGLVLAVVVLQLVEVLGSIDCSANLVVVVDLELVLVVEEHSNYYFLKAEGHNYSNLLQDPLYVVLVRDLVDMVHNFVEAWVDVDIAGGMVVVARMVMVVVVVLVDVEEVVPTACNLEVELADMEAFAGVVLVGEVVLVLVACTYSADLHPTDSNFETYCYVEESSFSYWICFPYIYLYHLFPKPSLDHP